MRTRAPGLLVHAIPGWIRSRVGAGNWKDVASRRLLWGELRRASTVVYFDEIRPESLLDVLPPDAEDVLLEYSWWPQLLRRLASERPGLRLHVRTHNAEALQHWARDERVPGSPYSTVRRLYGATRLLFRDWACRRSCDTLLGISEWDDRFYWSRLPGRAHLVAFPYYCPWPWLQPETGTKEYGARRAVVASLPGANDRLGRSVTQGLEQLSERLVWPEGDSPWRCVLSTGLLEGRRMAGRCSVEVVEDPWTFLGDVRVLAVLTDLGYGLKTTIVDGIAAGCHVLVPRRLSARLPKLLRAHCIVVDPTDSASVARAGAAVARPPMASRLNDELRLQALTTARSLWDVTP